MKHLDKNTVRDIRAELENALANVGKQFGMTFKVGTIHYSPSNCDLRCKLSAESKKTPNQKFAQITANFNYACQLHGIDPQAFGKTFTIGSTEYTLTGAKPSRPKFPFLGTGPQGGNYKFSANQVRMGLPKEYIK